MKLEPQSKFSGTDLESLLASKAKFELSPKAKKAIEKSHRLVAELAQSDRAIYGVNTGFGRLAQIRVSKEQLDELQINLLRSHACGFGEPLSESIVRRLLLLRVLSLGKGYSGISTSLLDRHLDYLNHALVPEVPEQGSVGASGDLAPLAHLGLTFIGEGFFIENQKRKTAANVLKNKKWKHLNVGPKEGLALTNGTHVCLSIALESLKQFRDLYPWMEAAACLCLEGHQATSSVFLSKIHELKAHPHQRKVARSFASKLRGSPHMRSHKDCDYVQDAYSFRCIPQVWGPALSIIDKAEELLVDEANSVSDNPLVFVENKEIYSAGHFHAQSVSLAADMMTNAFVVFSNMSERRIDQVVNPLHGRSPAFQATNPGVESGLMIVQTAGAAIASENKTLAFPASADTIPTNGDQEDHVSMAPWAARKSLHVLKNLRRIIAAEILTGVRACVHESTRTGASFSPYLEKLLKHLSEQHPQLFKSGDRVFSEDLRKLERSLESEFPV